jgi:hypothetical protein
LGQKICAIKKNAQTLSVASGEDSGENIRLSRFENRVLREMSGAKRAEVTGDWRELCNEELLDLCSIPYFWVIRSMRMKWTGHVACMWTKELTML